ncbi:MAG: acetylglutamate kinase [Balneolales bacterium]
MEPVLIKISGNLADDETSQQKICSFALQKITEGKPVVIVHGGGKQINELSKRLGVDVKQIAGRRITDQAALEVMLYTVGGIVNKQLVSSFRKQGAKAVGLTGIDGNLTTSHKRPPLSIDGVDVDFELVGEFDQIDPELVTTLLGKNFIPIIGCLTWSDDEGILNINADTFAINLARAIGCEELIMLMSPQAVLDGNQQPISELNRETWKAGITDGWIIDGMQPKLLTGFEALENGISKVILTNPDGLEKKNGTQLVN